MLGPHGRREGALNQAGTGRRAHRSRGKGVRVEYAIFGKLIDVWGDGIFLPITSENRTHIFRGDPEDVGPFLSKK